MFCRESLYTVLGPTHVHGLMATMEKLHTAEERIQLDRYVFKEEVTERMPEGHTPITLQQALSIKETDCYWISLHGKELTPRMVDGKGYEGRTFEGVPTEEGHYSVNNDNTFTKLNNKDDAAWSERLYVSPIAAAKATKGEDLGILYVAHMISYFTNVDSFLNVFSSNSKPGNVARMASVPKNTVQEMHAAVAEAVRK